jgi:hypothetical protein
MTDQPIRTQPEPLHLGRAAAVLEAVLAGSPDTGLDTATTLAVAGALATLDDVHPPYPPRPAPGQPVQAQEGITIALDELARAITQAGTAGQAILAGLAARELRHLDERTGRAGR